MQVISLTIKQRQGVTVNQVQLVDVDNIGTPILEANSGADASFFLREAKRGPYPGEPSNHALTSFVVDQTIANIVAASFSIFSAHILTMKGRAKVALMGFNVSFVAGNILPYNGGSKFFYQEDADPDLVEYTCTETPAQILAQITPVPVSVSLNVGKTVFVDASTGSDVTGLRERFDFMFASLEAAQAASLAGDTIIVYPGTYAPATVLGKNNVDWEFKSKTIVTANFSDNGAAMAFNVTGDGSFTAKAGSELVSTLNPSSNITFECISANALLLDNVFYASSGAKLSVFHCKDITAVGGSAIIADANNGATGGIIYVNGFGKITSQGVTICMNNPAQNGYIEINSKGGVELVDSVGSSTAVYVEGGTVIINTSVTGDNHSGGSYPTPIIGFNTGPVTLRINGDQICTSGVHLVADAPGTIVFNGKMTTVGTMNINNAGVVVKINNSEVITNPAAAQEIITLTAGKLKLSNTIIKNLKNDAVAYGIVKAGGTLILDDAIIVCAGATQSIHVAGAQDVKIYSAVANVDVTPALITNLISGTVLYVDADVE